MGGKADICDTFNNKDFLKMWNAQGLYLLERMESLQLTVLCPHANVKIQKALYWPDTLLPN